MLGPTLGAIFAGLFSWAHQYFLLNYTVEGDHIKKELEEEDAKEGEDNTDKNN